VANGKHVEHWLNGVKLVENEIGSPEWEQLGREEQVQGSPSLRAIAERSHRDSGSRRLGGVQEHQNPRTSVKQHLWVGTTAALVIALLFPAYSATAAAW
jgi:hypothetical protein